MCVSCGNEVTRWLSWRSNRWTWRKPHWPGLPVLKMTAVCVVAVEARTQVDLFTVGKHEPNKTFLWRYTHIHNHTQKVYNTTCASYTCMLCTCSCTRQPMHVWTVVKQRLQYPKLLYSENKSSLGVFQDKPDITHTLLNHVTEKHPATVHAWLKSIISGTHDYFAWEQCYTEDKAIFSFYDSTS